jgi:uncharacterized membrane protein YcaP (DUF421 family)
MLIVFFRALILYSVVFVVIRLMGKKELSKVQPFELAIIILISELASAPMSSRGISIFDGIVPIVTLLISYIIFTMISRSSNKVQDVMCGTLSVIIRDGKIIEDEFAKQGYTISDLMSQIREHDIFKLQDIKYGFIETNGNLSVIKNTDNMNMIPMNIIEDGQECNIGLQILNMNKEALDNLMKKNNLKIEDVLVGTIDENGNFAYQIKENKEVTL